MHHDRRHTPPDIINAERGTYRRHQPELIPEPRRGSGIPWAHPPLSRWQRWRKVRNPNPAVGPFRQRGPAEITLPPLPAPGPHLLRVLQGAVIDFPAPMLHPQAQRWAATCWPDLAQPGGWCRARWWTSACSRGYLPVALDYADVVEFAADIPFRHWWATRWWPVRWYGVVVQDSPRGLVVYGPYPTADAAQRIGDELRCTLAYHYSVRRS